MPLLVAVTSFVLAALRRSRLTAAVRGGVGSDRGIPLVWSGPAARFVAGLVPDQGVGDPVGASRHTRTVAGYFLPQFAPSKMSNS
ncbi:MAG TPA: hypothetical protein VF086_11520 [Propionibacteriaceae bacterium]